MKPGHWCDICLRKIYAEHGRYNIDGVKPGRAITSVAGVSVCSEHADEVLAKILGEKPKPKVRPTEIDDGMGWQDEHDPLSGNPIGEQEEIAGRIT